jgi:hypothetical protein
MAHDAENASPGTMPAQPLPTPFAPAACNIDFADDSPSQKPGIIGVHNLADELVAWYTRKPIIAAQQFKISVAYSARYQPDRGETFWAPRAVNIANSQTALVDVDSQHELPIVRGGTYLKGELPCPARNKGVERQYHHHQSR